MDADLLTLCADLERVFELDELKSLSLDVLGLDPDTIGGGTAKASFAKALTQRCLESDAVVALCDAMAAAREDLDPRVTELRSHGVGGDDDLELGDEFGPYLVLRRLGRGRVGTVYLARRDGADVRLKVLRREATYDRVGLQRFLAASRLASSVGHHGLPRRATAGEIQGRYFVAHGHVEGQTLAARIARTGAMHIEEARGVLSGILEALAQLHARRLAHGSLRLENVLVGTAADGSDSVVLLDAGGYHLGVAPPPANGRSDRLASIGSPKTLSPEQIEGRLPDARSDLYSFGAVLFEVLTGRPVHETTSAAEAFMAHLTREAPLPSLSAPAGWAGADIDDLVTQLLNKDPTNRPSDAGALFRTIETLGTGGASSEEMIDEDALEERVRSLLSNPTDTFCEEELVASIRQGGSPRRVAEALRLAADLVDPDEGPEELAASEPAPRRAPLGCTRRP